MTPDENVILMGRQRLLFEQFELRKHRAKLLDREMILGEQAFFGPAVHGEIAASRFHNFLDILYMEKGLRRKMSLPHSFLGTALHYCLVPTKSLAVHTAKTLAETRIIGTTGANIEGFHEAIFQPSVNAFRPPSQAIAE